MTHLLKAVGALVSALLTVAGCLASTDSGSGTQHGMDGGPTLRDRALAVSVARDEVHADEASIESATVLVTTGRLSEPETLRACGAGRLLSIKLIGAFPHITTTGHPASPGGATAPEDFTVHAVLLTVSAHNGSVCLRGVTTGEVEPEPGASDLRLEPGS